MALYFIVAVGILAAPLDIIIAVHLITAAVSSELKSQRDEVPDTTRTVMWAVVWIAVTVIITVVVGIASATLL